MDAPKCRLCQKNHWGACNVTVNPEANVRTQKTKDVRPQQPVRTQAETVTLPLSEYESLLADKADAEKWRARQRKNRDRMAKQRQKEKE